MEGMGRKGQKKRRLTFTGLDRLMRLDGKDNEGIGLLTIPSIPLFCFLPGLGGLTKKGKQINELFYLHSSKIDPII